VADATDTAKRVIYELILDTFDRSNSRYGMLNATELDALETLIYGGLNSSGNGTFAEILRKVNDRERERVRHDDEFGRRFRDESTAGPDGLAPAKCA